MASENELTAPKGPTRTLSARFRKGHRAAWLLCVLAVVAAFSSQITGAEVQGAVCFWGPPDGSTPYGPVTLDRDGNVYGTTLSGGKHFAGTVFKISQSGRRR